MGQDQILTKEQQIILAEINQNPFFKRFYFTRGTALSAFYLQHRNSEDLDFFTENAFDTQPILALMQNWSKKHNFTFTSEFQDVVYILLLTFQNNAKLKVDFGHYPYKCIKEPVFIEDTRVDSLLDIAINKLLVVTQRNEVKDFVDLYFLLQQFTIGDLLEGVKIKFNLKIDPYILASDFLKVEDFEFLPNMIKPLTMDELKAYFTKRAEEIGKRYTEL